MAEKVALRLERAATVPTGYVIVAVVVDPSKCGLPMADTPEFKTAVQANIAAAKRKLEGRAAVVLSAATQAEIKTDAELDAEQTAAIAEVQAQIALRKSMRADIGDLQ